MLPMPFSGLALESVAAVMALPVMRIHPETKEMSALLSHERSFIYRLPLV